jgi:carbonic anhydrase/acetyltransferase-like protein (isoleucine patch superfamily)
MSPFRYGRAAFVAAALSLVASASLHAQTFVDPTATFMYPEHVTLGNLVYVGPFATLRAGAEGEEEFIVVGGESNIQDNVTISARGGEVALGEMAILAHGSTVRGPATIGETGVCPPGQEICPSFVGFNSEVEGAVIEKDAMVLHLARVAPGVVIPSGRKVLSGKNVASQSEVEEKTAVVTEGDRAFMHGVIEVNVAFAEKYHELAVDPGDLTGINYDPGHTEFNHDADLPTLAGEETQDPDFRNRIIGDVRLADDWDALNKVMGQHISLRADEGEPFEIGTIADMNDRVTMHGLEHTHIHLGDHGRYGYRSIVHGGPSSFPLGSEEPDNTTVTGDNVKIGTKSVFFRSRIGADSKIGSRTLLQQVDCPAGTVFKSRQIVVGDGTNCPAPSYRVEW